MGEPGNRVCLFSVLGWSKHKLKYPQGWLRNGKPSLKPQQKSKSTQGELKAQGYSADTQQTRQNECIASSKQCLSVFSGSRHSALSP